jgi:predicted hotdog family 3-hydroxylacyl-ACP dehydratase
VSIAAVDRNWLLANLPHQGRMNLLDRVVEWDAATLHATTARHRDLDHPLRRGDMLPSTAGIELAAQAAAAHGALAAGGPSGAGMIASVRGVRFHKRNLNDVAGELDVRVEQLGSSDAGVLYGFTVRGGGALLLEGRLSVAFSR